MQAVGAFRVKSRHRKRSKKHNESETMSAFTQVIRNEAELRDVLGYAGQAAQDKVIPEIDEICRAFIARSPFVLLGSANANGCS
jgi:hypothetical protein